MPEIDEEILGHWLTDETLFFSSQDEDLLMQDISTQRLIEALSKAAPGRVRQIYEILAVKLHDDTFSSKEERKQTIAFMDENRSEWENANIWPYIRDGMEKKIRRHKNFFWRLFGA